MKRKIGFVLDQRELADDLIVLSSKFQRHTSEVVMVLFGKTQGQKINRQSKQFLAAQNKRKLNRA
jgi:hypothetical protein